MLRNCVVIGMGARPLRAVVRWGSLIDWTFGVYLVELYAAWDKLWSCGWVIGIANLHRKSVIVACPIHQLQPSLVINIENLFI